MAYRWFIGYDMTEKIPYFSTFGKNNDSHFFLLQSKMLLPSRNLGQIIDLSKMNRQNDKMSDKFGKKYMDNGCSTIASEDLNVTVPMIVRGFADVGDVSFACKGSPLIRRNSEYTPGQPNAVSVFTVSQRLHVDIPIVFGADVDAGQGFVEYDSHEDEKPCKDK